MPLPANLRKHAWLLDESKALFSATAFVVSAKCCSGRSVTTCLGHATIAPILKGKQAPPKQRLEDGRSRNAPEDHPAMDVASEGKTADARTGSRLCEDGNRAKRTSPKPTRPIRKSGGLAFATDRQVSYVCSTPGVIIGSWEHPVAHGGVSRRTTAGD